MFEIALVNDRGVALVDDEDAARVVNRRWYRHSEGYACGPEGRPLLHRFLLNAPRGVLVDHRNGNRLDCRRENLRLTGYSLNAFNRSVADCRSRSGIPGVSARRSSYAVYIFANGRRIYLGSRKTLLDAARLRAEGEIKHYGEVSPATRAALGGLNHI